MLHRYTLLALLVPFSVFADQIVDSRPNVKQAAVEVSPEVFRERAKHVAADIATVLEKIEAREKSGKSFAEAPLAQLLRLRGSVLKGETTQADNICKTGGCAVELLHLDRDAVLATYADALLSSGDRASALRALAQRSPELSRDWIIRDENDPRLRDKGEEAELEVVNRNFLFDTKDEAALTPDLKQALEKARIVFLDEQIGGASTPAGLAEKDSPLRSGKPR